MENQEDIAIWIHHNSGSFTVKSCYHEIIKPDELIQSQTFAKIWKGLIPHRVEVFLWLALHGRLNTKQKLVALNILPESEILCPLCKSFPEDTMHLFFQCAYSRSVWQWWWMLWNISWVWPSSIKLAFEQWFFPTRSNFFRKIWSAIFPTILWSIWKERNERIFNNVASPHSDICHLILLRLCWWLKAWKEPFPYSVDEVIRNPSCLRWSEVCTLPRRTLAKAQSASIKRKMPISKCLKWCVGSSSNILSQGLIMGGILINETAQIICAFSCPSPLTGSDEVSVLAVHRAIQISLSSNAFKNQIMEIEMDNITAKSGVHAHQEVQTTSISS